MEMEALPWYVLGVFAYTAIGLVIMITTWRLTYRASFTPEEWDGPSDKGASQPH